MRFANPWAVLLVLFLLAIWYLARKKGRLARPGFVPVGFLSVVRLEGRDVPSRLIRALKWLLLALLLFALARPQWGKGYRTVTGKVADIMLVLDVSGSMLAMDMGGRSRIEVAKESAKRFVEGREGDRIGLVLFASKTFLQCPLTLDHDVLKRLIDESKVGMIPDGTAIGSAIATAIRHMRGIKSDSKVIVLITDGVNNAGKIDPLTASELAKKLGIRIYTIGVGSDNPVATFAVSGPFGLKQLAQGSAQLDEELLRRIAQITGGRYFRVRDPVGMKRVFEDIDRMEKHEIKVKRFYVFKDVFPTILKVSLGLLILVVLLEDLVFLTVPQ